MEMKGRKGAESVSDEISFSSETSTGADDRTTGDVSHGVDEDGNYETALLLIARSAQLALI